MTTTIAFTGKSGSGKTSVLRALLELLQESYSDKTFLLVDSDLSLELGLSLGYDIRNTIYGIRSGKHQYQANVEDISQQEFVDWALEDIVEPVSDNIDMIVTWLLGSKDCRCPITSDIRNGFKKLIKRYDFVLFDCEFDLKYLIQLVDCSIDATLIIAKPTQEGVRLAHRIEDYSKKYATGQMGVILNQVKNGLSADISSLLNCYNLDILGVIPFDEELSKESTTNSKNSEIIQEALKEILFRLNLPAGRKI